VHTFYDSVWGVLAQGALYIHVLDEGEVMNQDLYTESIEDKFENWLSGSNYLVQDFEACLRSAGPLHAFSQIGIELVPGYPKCSQDFNAMENCWHHLHDRLNTTLPVGIKFRSDFIDRLTTAVAWLNRQRKTELWHFATNQKDRCRACLAMKPPGGRTKW